MSLQVSTALKVYLLSLFPSVFNGGFIRVYSGVQPATADEAVSGDYLGSITLRGLPEGLGVGAGLTFDQVAQYITKPYTDLWQLAVVNSGIAGWFRLFMPGDVDDGGASLLYPRVDGVVTDNTGVGELRLPSLTLTAGDVVGPINFFYTIKPLLGG